jgi:hypothetical protein
MANILLRFNDSAGFPKNSQDTEEQIIGGAQCNAWIYGQKGTFCLVRNGEDAIASIGYVSHINSDSGQKTLEQILSSFQESQIDDLKKTLIGQYVLLIKKGHTIYLFSDFIGGRNIFYCDDKMIVSTSFSNLEDILQTSHSDLDTYKVSEFLAVKHLLYPAWLGRTTKHKRIKWLLPYEYLAIDTANSSFRIGSVVYSIDNKKQSDCSLLASELLTTLKLIIDRKEFKGLPVAASMTGGRDSRLVGAIVAEQYKHIHFRTAVSSGKYTSLRDLKVANKVARICGVTLDIYRFQQGRDEQRFYELTEGFAPSYNHSITPLIDSVESYSLGFGGVFGTEVFMPIQWGSIEGFINAKVDSIKQVLRLGDDFWKHFRESLHAEFQSIKKHFRLSLEDDRDYIRLFCLINTARYGSFILAAFNRSGYELEPYGTYPVVDLAFRVSPALWGNHRTLGGDALVQKAAMAQLNPRLGRVLTYGSLRPMLPLSFTTAPFYTIGLTLHIVHWLRQRFVEIKKGSTRTDLPDGYYLSNGWEKNFIDRTAKKYGLSAECLVKPD